jgi:outer membrane protein OmpA-like peptidoglycan-associated protein
VAAAGRDKTARVLAELKAGRELQVLSADEQKFVEEVRQDQKGASHQAISDQWHRLTQARLALPSLSSDDVAVAQELQKAYPDIKDPKRLVSLVGQGLAAEKKGEHDWPPIINLSEAQGYFFATGKAEIDPDFENHLRTVIVPQLVQLTGQYGVGTIEVIGHTDEQRITQRTSNLDTFLLDTLHDTANVSALIPADNAGLGLARAVAVTRILAQDDRLRPYTILPLSAGQLITPSDRLTAGGGGADKERRRIEIRLRRSNPTKLLSTR